MTARTSTIFIYGASGHASVIIDIIQRENRHTIDFVIDDDARLKDSVLGGYHVVGGREALSSRPHADRTLVAIGDNKIRAALADWLRCNGYSLITAVDPSAIVSRDATLGCGTVVMMGAVINTGTIIGDNVIINTRAGVDHDCRLGSGVHIAPGSTICGNVTLGENVFIGAGATVTPNVTIGEKSMIGAGTVIYKDVPGESRIVGPRQDW